MATTEVSRLVRNYALAGSGVTALIGPGYGDFPISGGGFRTALEIPGAIVNGHHDFRLNPFGGYNTYEPFVITDPKTNAPVIDPQSHTPEIGYHALYHQYSFAQGLDLLAGEATVALLVIGALAAGVNRISKMKAGTTSQRRTP